jgi:hypothetical protein
VALGDGGATMGEHVFLVLQKECTIVDLGFGRIIALYDWSYNGRPSTA